MAKREKIERLAKESPNAGERAAARAALDRLPQPREPIRGTAEWHDRERAKARRVQTMVGFLSVNRGDPRLSLDEQKMVRRLAYFNANADRDGTIERLATKLGWIEHV